MRLIFICVYYRGILDHLVVIVELELVVDFCGSPAPTTSRPVVGSCTLAPPLLITRTTLSQCTFLAQATTATTIQAWPRFAMARIRNNCTTRDLCGTKNQKIHAYAAMSLAFGCPALARGKLPSTLVPAFCWQANASGSVQISLIHDIG